MTDVPKDGEILFTPAQVTAAAAEITANPKERWAFEQARQALEPFANTIKNMEAVERALPPLPSASAAPSGPASLKR